MENRKRKEGRWPPYVRIVMMRGCDKKGIEGREDAQRGTKKNLRKKKKEKKEEEDQSTVEKRQTRAWKEK